jgi:type IV pilus biogenesis/stability protein PilW
MARAPRRSWLAVALALACAHTPSPKERETAEIHYNLGLEALRAGRQQEALKELDQALQGNPQFPEAYLGRGIVYEFGYGKLADAERDYRKALELKADYPEAHNNLGQLLARTNRLEEAIREFEAALENMFYREPFVARCNKGQALFRMGKRDEGLQELRACLTAAPRYCQGHRELGRIELEQGRVKEALEEFRRYAELCDKVADAWFQLGLAQMKAGDPDKAREAFERCQTVGGAEPLADECRRKVEALQ